MKKITISILIVLNASISWASDTCKIICNKKYLLEINRQVIVSLVFGNDSIYQIRSEKEANKWISHGSWTLNPKKIVLLPSFKESPLKLVPGTNTNKGLIKSGNNYYFLLKKGEFNFSCNKKEKVIILYGYKFVLRE